MKTIIIILILCVVGFFAFKALYKQLTGKGGCGCSGGGKSCPLKNKCPSRKK
jgi:hypothetical protein